MHDKWTKIGEILDGKKEEGEKVRIRGWIYRSRSSGGILFVVIRDSSGIIQAVVRKGNVPEEDFKNAEKALIESSVQVEGIVKKDERAPGGYEIEVKRFNVVSFAEPFPITENYSEEFLLDVRHLWLRSQKMTNILKVRSKVFEAIRDFMKKEGYYEVQPPIITCAGSEGGATLFEVKYFDRKAYLSQSWQLYGESIIMALEKAYCLAPSFRAEKSRTPRHVTEFWHFEVEEAWVGMEEMLNLAERVLSYICRRVADECKKELSFLGRDVEDLYKIEPPFPRITYDEAINILREKGHEIEYGKDFGIIEERLLVEGLDKPLVITHYPKEIMAFYKKRDPNNPNLTLNFNIIANELGDEIVDGSERESDINEIIRALKAQGNDPKDFDFYLDSRRYGSVPHSGFGMGVDRVVMWICKLKNIRDAIPFPRTVSRIYP
ncbi:MAG: asparagine--tRNA ligase [Thermoplasmata archaeon]|nr:MAG: asparagine--tRNA ligase [Thermoplasmata archaeon]RLF40078.1 MAG: asparagine--tRNA ligase [Thermoplasmata archaeon]